MSTAKLPGESVPPGLFEQDLSAKRVFLEIGYGLTPTVFNLDRNFTGDSYYIGIDAAEGDYSRRESKTYGEAVLSELGGHLEKAATRPNENIYFLLGNASNLVFLDNESVAEVYMANVLHSPVPPPERREVLSEVKRVLRPGGKLASRTSWDLWITELPAEIKRYLKQAGFENVRTTDSKTERSEFDLLEEAYGRSLKIERFLGFFTTASKARVT